MDRTEYRREWRRKNAERLNNKYRDYHRAYSRKRRGTPKGYKGKCAQGRHYELLAHKNVLLGSIDMNATSLRGPYDLEWDGKQVDVKSAHINKKGVWIFTTRPTCKATHFLCFCVMPDKRIAYVFLFPRKVFKQCKAISINHLAPYSPYRLDWSISKTDL